MNKIYIQTYTSPIGELIVGDYNGQLSICDWKHRKMRAEIDQRITKGLNCTFEIKETTLIETVIKQLKEYFSGERETFEIPLLLIGTDFQKQVWNELQKIPFGKTETYLNLSRMLNNEKAIRAVAAANGANAIAIIVPCHRIIGSNKKLVGYAGGLKAKQKLLQIEGSLDNDQLSLF